MNFSLKISLFLAVALGLFFTACMQQDQLKPSDESSTKSERSDDPASNETPSLFIPYSCDDLFGSIDYRNPANPYDYIGQAHNDGLDYNAETVPASVWANFTPDDIDPIVNSTHRFAIEEGYQPLEERAIQRIIEDTKSSMRGVDLLDQSYADGMISFELYSVIQELLNQLNGNYQVGNLEQVAKIVEKAKDVESGIASNEKLSNEEKALAYISGAIMRYSLVYWTCQVLSNDQFAAIFSEKAAGSRASCWEFFVGMASQDVKSGATAGATSSIFGGFFGFLGGVFVGGTVGSLAQGVTSAATNGPCN